MTDPISCESWATGTPFLGIPSKFVIVNEDGENIGTLADLLLTLLYKDGNLAELSDKAISRENLGVYSTTQTDNAISTAITNAATPDASETIKGKAARATLAEVLAGIVTDDFVTPFTLQARYKTTWYDVTGFRLFGTTYTNTNNYPIKVAVKSSIATNSVIFLRANITPVTGPSTSIPFASMANAANLAIAGYVEIPAGAAYSINVYDMEDNVVTGFTVASWQENKL